MTTIQSRRKLIVIILLCVAVAGAVLRYLAAPGSTARDVGTLLMLLWVPIIGNVIAWLIGRLRRPDQLAPSPFDARGAFEPQLQVELTLRPPGVPAADLPVAAGEHRCAFVVGNEAFSARWWVPEGRSFRRGTVQLLEAEFLAPAVALPRFEAGTDFRMLVGDSFVGDGCVIAHLPRTGQA
ncbi:hypothetical protein QTH87_12770 [Variovorax sp. J22P168]|uniref:hypothetical protein n=1 Tax=Variovorax jilinensis TaxID=3053513 RepID=UPI0025777496|nr:hypothetical protein [Variovorax sp. J22P168]MDM0013309.1 hypothetical protein [Variovorax sp. J22P168]